MRKSSIVQEWKQEERIETLRETLVRLLTKRFGIVPAAVGAQIEAVADPVVLSAAIEQVLDLARIEDLRF